MTQRDDLENQLVDRAQRDPEFRARLLDDPRSAVAEALAVELPAALTIRVIEEQPGEAVLVLPAPAPEGAVAEADLAGVAGGTAGAWLSGATNCSGDCGCRTARDRCPEP